MTELTSPPVDDHETYIDTVEVIRNRRVSIAACTVAGDINRPNEDTFAFSRVGNVLYAGVFDGVTNLKPSIDKGETGARFASHFLRDHFAPDDDAISPTDLVSRLNQELLAANSARGATLDDVHTLALSTGTIARIDRAGNRLEVAHVGDGFCIIEYEDGTSVLLTADKNRPFDQALFTLIEETAREKGITPREVMDASHVKEEMQSRFTKKVNTPDGSGTGYISGDPAMEPYVQSVLISLRGVRSILLGTDGLLPLGVSVESEEGRKALLDEIEINGLKGLIKRKKESEDADPDFMQHTRFKHSDDATALYVKFKDRHRFDKDLQARYEFVVQEGQRTFQNSHLTMSGATLSAADIESIEAYYQVVSPANPSHPWRLQAAVSAQTEDEAKTLRDAGQIVDTSTYANWDEPAGPAEHNRLARQAAELIIPYIQSHLKDSDLRDALASVDSYRVIAAAALHDIGRFATHLPTNGPIGKLILQRIGIRPDIVTIIPDEKIYFQVPLDKSMEEAVRAMSPEMVLVALADNFGKRYGRTNRLYMPSDFSSEKMKGWAEGYANRPMSGRPSQRAFVDELPLHLQNEDRVYPAFDHWLQTVSTISLEELVTYLNTELASTLPEISSQ